MLQDEEASVQAPQVQLVLHVIVDDLPTPHDVLEISKHQIKARRHWEVKDETTVWTHHTAGKAPVALP